MLNITFKKNEIIRAAFILLFVTSLFYFYRTTWLALFIGITLFTIVLTASRLTMVYYEKNKEKESPNETLIGGCLYFIGTTALYFIIKYFSSFVMSYHQLLMIGLMIYLTSQWSQHKLKGFEKIIIAVTMLTMLATMIYLIKIPRTAIEMYNSYISLPGDFEKFNSNILPYYPKLTEEEYKELKSNIANRLPYRIGQYAVLFYPNGEILLVDTAHGDLDARIMIRSIKWVPEEYRGIFQQE